MFHDDFWMRLGILSKLFNTLFCQIIVVGSDLLKGGKILNILLLNCCNFVMIKIKTHNAIELTYIFDELSPKLVIDVRIR